MHVTVAEPTCGTEYASKVKKQLSMTVCAEIEGCFSLAPTFVLEQDSETNG